MKAIIIITLAFTLFNPTAQAGDLGKLESNNLISLHEERVHNLVANSSDIRSSIEVGRSVAGVSEEDKKWAQEFTDLMNDESEKDYLGMAAKL